MKIHAIECLKCGCVIYSRARHDMRPCKCGRMAIDGGLDYMKISGSPNNYEMRTIEVDVTPKILYDDWRYGTGRYGLIEGGEPCPKNKAKNKK